MNEFDYAAGVTGVRALLRAIGENPEREGLQDTPERVLKAMLEMTDGHSVDIAGLLKTSFDGENYDEIVAVTGIDFVSVCEHHLLPFTGLASFAYIPSANEQGNARRVVGLSKIPRLVDAFARRLQMQERMTTQIADAFEHNVKPHGVAVLIKAEHQCMRCRGARKVGAKMITSVMRGAFRDSHAARDEVMKLLLS